MKPFVARYRLTRIQKWEYATIDITQAEDLSNIDPNPTDQLNDLGEEGWELVATVEGGLKKDATPTTLLILKRPK